VMVQGKRRQIPLLHAMACANAHPHRELAESMSLLVAASADIDAPFTDLAGFGATAVMFALERKCCTAVAAVLLQCGADPCVSVPGSMTAMHAAARFGLSDTCELLLARADTLLEARDKFGRTALIYAASYGRADNAQILLQHGADVNAVDDKGSTALVFACWKEHMDVTASLLEAGADVNVADCHGNSLLMAAAQSGSVQVVQLLLDHGADINMTNEDGQNALFKAASEGHVAVLELLVQRGCSITAVDSLGITVLMAAATAETTAAAEWLLQQGVAVDDAAHDGSTALHVTCSECSSDDAAMIELLLANDADVNKRTDEGITALLVAARQGNMSCVRALIAAGGHVVDGNAVEFSTLHAAIRGQHSAVAQLLLEHGATAVLNSVVAEKCDNGKHCCTGLTALMMCTTVETVKVLLAAGADVHVTNAAGDTCLHVAARHSYAAPVLCLLIKAGVDLLAVNSSGKTAAQLAHDRGHVLIEQLLN
jgi:uncharacterized protein